jgi:quercetin dioxygenase-like cupin family protein
MPILDRRDVQKDDLAPGVERWAIVDGGRGAESLSVGDVWLAPGGTAPTHFHPTEEAMVILEGELEAILGDDIVTVTEGETVLAPAGVKHGFTNRSGSPARVMAIFPTARIERTLVE